MGYIFALFSSVSWAISDGYAKRLLKNHGIFSIIWARYLIALFVLFPFFLFSILKGFSININYFLFLIAQIPLVVLAFIIYLWSIKHSPLSLTLPFLSLTPLFLSFFTPIVLKENVSPKGFIGIIFISAGSFFLFFSTPNPKSFFKEKGVWGIILVSFIFNWTAILSKICVQLSSPLIHSFFFALGMFCSFSVLLKGKFFFFKNNPLAKAGIKDFFLTGIFYAFEILFHNLGILLGKVAYIIAIKRTQGIFGVLVGYLFFKEQKITLRCIGAFLMCVGGGTLIVL